MIGRTNAGGGGGGKKSLVLPTNPDLSIKSDDSKLVLSWTQPGTEVEVDHYNIYTSLTAPSSLNDMALKGSTSNLTYELTGLTNDQTYYVGIQAVSVEGYENASIWKVKNGVPSAIIWVAVGDGGNGAYSTDGLTWNNLAVRTGADLRTVIYKNGFFYYGGTIGVIMKINPINGEWQTCYDGIGSATINSICYGNDRFVAVCNEGKSYYSLDGKTWVTMSGLYSGYKYNSVDYGNGRYIAVGDSGSVFGSINGTNWISGFGIKELTDNIYAVKYGNDRFVLIGENGKSYYLLDGSTSWVAMSGLNTTSSYYGVTYGNGMFVCISNNGYSYYSKDGVSWNQIFGIGLGTAIYGVTYNRDRFICVGTNGISYYVIEPTNQSWTAMSGLDASTQYNAICSNATE